jgi:hypothetical protein
MSNECQQAGTAPCRSRGGAGIAAGTSMHAASEIGIRPVARILASRQLIVHPVFRGFWSGVVGE